ncbi:hypothetical protein Ais01nite_23110 [Asanoa ishikariensis]|uniref:DUF2092 domain-containing protein n=1 Tax=Asanoa ishikariensis TaxID=137265 RepID=A0A1H3R8T7_9ACTN|nr:hypothetical protein [Asanoa ishikariensis]GIF64276.1 hypothetical protein Ais01nite_23110 [Asanoa ishikariensis]SDZ22077.1 hypothetical protein SAMN05421684_3601 [Asanoa ishikariensis]
MHNLDERLAHGLHRIVDGEADSIPPTGKLLERGRRGRRRRVSALAGSTLAVVALGALGIAAVAQPTRDVPAGASSAQAPSPELKLASAFATSKDLSYRLRLTTASRAGAGPTYEGAFDPRTDTGYLALAQNASVRTELLINGTRYTIVDRPKGEKYGYRQQYGRHDRLSLYDSPMAVVALAAGGGELPAEVARMGSASPDPAALYEILRKANATITENGDGSLHFVLSTQDQGGSNGLSGDITRDADGRIGKVTLTSNWSSMPKIPTGTMSATLELFDYGVDVKVERPTDIVPSK